MRSEEALLASAIRWVSSFFLKAAPSPLLAATISLASLSAMLRPLRSRLYLIIHLMLEGYLPVGTNLRRDLEGSTTNTAAADFHTRSDIRQGFFQTSYPSSPVCLATFSKAHRRNDHMHPLFTAPSGCLRNGNQFIVEFLDRRHGNLFRL